MKNPSFNNRLNKYCHRKAHMNCNEQTRILQIFFSQGGEFGGIEAFVSQLNMYIDKEKFIFDYLCVNKNAFGPVETILKSLGANIYTVEVRYSNKYIKLLVAFITTFRFLKHNQYKVVHIHNGNIFLLSMQTLAARCAGIHHIIAHAHSAEVVSSFNPLKRCIYRVCRLLVSRCAHQCCACSELAAQYAYLPSLKRTKHVIIRNGIEPERFIYSKSLCEQCRSELGWNNDSFVIGNIGRFSIEKNHKFLVYIFQKVHQIEPSARLLLVGTGALQKEIRALIDELGLSAVVAFVGQTKEPGRYYQAMDVFVLPSLYEGLPVTGIEAQASGLHCIFSDSITREASICGLVDYLPLSGGTELWTKRILQYANIYTRNDMSKYILNCGYDIRSVAQMVDMIYEK